MIRPDVLLDASHEEWARGTARILREVRMIAGRYGLIAMLVATLAGCAGGPAISAHIETLNNEYRQLEDQFYLLESENQRLCLEIERLEREAAGEKPPTSDTGRGLLRSRLREEGGLPPRPNIDLEPPMIEIPGAGDPPIIDPPRERQGPRLDPVEPNPPPPTRAVPNPSSLRKPAVEEPTTPEPAERPAIEAPNVPVEDLPLPPAKPATPSAPEPIDPRVTHLFLNPTLTGGNDFDGQGGDDGLSILIEPRNSKEQYVPQAGAISVVVLDPAKQGEAARIARWDFDLSTTREKLKRVSAADGIHLQMPWPAKPPEHNRLKVFVRYETADGRKLQTDREIFVALPGEVSQRWTPRPPSGAKPSAATAKAPVNQPSTTKPEPPARADVAKTKAKLIVPPPSLGDAPAEEDRTKQKSLR